MVLFDQIKSFIQEKMEGNNFFKIFLRYLLFFEFFLFKFLSISLNVKHLQIFENLVDSLKNKFNFFFLLFNESFKLLKFTLVFSKLLLKFTQKLEFLGITNSNSVTIKKKLYINFINNSNIFNSFFFNSFFEKKD